MAIVYEIIKIVRIYLKPYMKKARTKGISVEEKVMISLKTLASGSFQSSVKDLFAATQPTVCRCLNEFVEILINKAFYFIYMLRNQEECNKIKNGFFQIAGFRWVLGCVDGTHIPIVAPTLMNLLM